PSNHHVEIHETEVLVSRAKLKRSESATEGAGERPRTVGPVLSYE
ncbi:hypothetical protein F443_08232, partial [Phytophthora nicotianae P1569]